MSKKIRWGILSTANIAVKKVIPSMQEGGLCEISAIASRDSEKARITANSLGIKKHYSSYEELLADAEIDAIYNPLPNHLHLQWTTKAAEAGKHVLCEKPIGMNDGEVRELIKVRDQYNVKIQEAFMVRTHPKWLAVRDLIKQGRIGNLQAITGFFSYFNDDKSNIRNNLATGGGALMDIGCYCLNISRWLFEAEPNRVASLIERDRETGVDILTSAMLDFPTGQSTFSCSTRLVPFQRMEFFGTKGRIEVQIPFNIPLETPTKIFIDDGTDLYGENIETIEFETANQYTIQGDLFSQSILDSTEQPLSLEDSYKNMAAIDAVFRSAETGNWEIPKTF
jgi:predicted dehydrogenase